MLHNNSCKLLIRIGHCASHSNNRFLDSLMYDCPSVLFRSKEPIQLNVWNTINLERSSRKGEIMVNKKNPVRGEAPVRNSKLTSSCQLLPCFQHVGLLGLCYAIPLLFCPYILMCVLVSHQLHDFSFSRPHLPLIKVVHITTSGTVEWANCIPLSTQCGFTSWYS